MNFGDGKFARRLTKLIAMGGLLGAAVAPALAHRLDEYLQATLIALEKDGASADMYLTPGVAVLPTVLAAIDTNADGVISPAERRAYAERVLGDLVVTVNGERLKPQLVSVEFPSTEDLKDGRGDIHLVFKIGMPKGAAANIPAANGAEAASGAVAGRRLTLKVENRHQSGISAYQVNSLMPRDPGLKVVAEERNYEQSVYRVEWDGR